MPHRPEPPDATATSAPLPRVNPDFLVRDRLIELLDRWSPITVLLAPSGTGKAVLAIQWAAHARDEGHDVIWLDGEVDGPDTAVAALARLAGLEAGADRASTLRRLRRALQRRGRRLAVVVNNAESLLGVLGEELVDVVRDCRTVHLVACLRRRLDPVAKALLEAETRVIGTADLQFTTDEVRELADRHGLVLTPVLAEEIHESVGGWAALVRTGLEQVTDPDGHDSTRWSPRQVAWFLDVNLIPTVDRSAWKALQRAALVEQPVFGAVVAATGPLDEPARIALETIGVLDPLVTTGEPIFRLPPLVRAHVRDRYDPARLGPPREIHEEVVRFWLDRSEPAHALGQAAAGGCWTLAVSIIDRHFWGLVAADPETLRDSLRSIPAAHVRARPRVELAHQLLNPDEPETDSPALSTRIQDLVSTPAGALAALTHADALETLDLLTLLIARERARGELESALAHAERVDLISPIVRSTSPAPPAVRRAGYQCGTTRMLAGRPDAGDAFRMVAAGHTDPDPLAAAAAGGLALLAALHADRATTALWLDRWRTTHPAPAPLDGHLALPARLAGALETLQSLDRDDSELRALQHEVPPDHELRPLVLWLQAQHALAWGGRSRAGAQLRAARAQGAHRPLGPWLVSLLGAGEAELYLSQGRTAIAARLLGELDPQAAPVAIARSRLARMTGRAAEALHLLEPVIATDHPYAAARLEALVLTAWCHRGHDEAAARSALQAAVRAARRERLVLPFSLVPREVLVPHAGAIPDLAEVLGMLERSGVRASYAVGDALPVLTPREEAVLHQLAGPHSLDQIARALFVSRNTVKTQTASLYRKLGVRGRGQAVRRAYQLGLLD